MIPDGNRRWAVQHGMEKQEGYQYGLRPGLDFLRLARDSGVEEVSYYGFTVDNCKRPHAQREAFSNACVEAVSLLAEDGVSLLVVGNAESPMFPDPLRPYTTRTDLNGGGIKVNFLVNYGWEWDLAGLCGAEAPGKPQEHLRSAGVSRMDMVIRWGGMRRLSGFLPAQSVYADFYVVDRLWPDFCPEDFREALGWYARQDDTLGG